MHLMKKNLQQYYTVHFSNNQNARQTTKDMYKHKYEEMLNTDTVGCSFELEEILMTQSTDTVHVFFNSPRTTL